MDQQSYIFLEHLPHDAFAFSLILTRVAGVIILLPGLGEVAAPAMVRVGLAGAVTILLLPGLMPTFPGSPATILDYAVMVASSLITGLWLGWLARTITFALGMSGQWIAAILGLSNVLAPDIITGGEEPALGRLLDLASPVLLLITGLYAMPLVALSSSFDVIPPGGFLPIGDGMQIVVTAVVRCFLLALQLSAPFVVAAICWNIALGIISRLVPRVQIYFLGLPGQILGGLGLLAVLISALLHAWLQATSQDFSNLARLV